MKKSFYIILVLLLSNLFFNGINAQQTNGPNIILNPSFDVNDAGWSHYFDYFWDPTNPLAADANVSVVTKAGYTGNAYKVTILKPGVAEYAVQIAYPVALEAGKKYAMKFKASADAIRTVQLNMQQDVGAKTIWYTSNPIPLTTTPTVLGPYEFTATTTDASNLFKFYLGGGGTANAISAYFDDVEVTELTSINGATVPGAPTNVSAVAGSANATVSFTSPVNTGLLSLIDYTVIASPGGTIATGTTSPIVVNGLNSGQSYTFTVVANNSLGASAPSVASNAVTPGASNYGANIILNPSFDVNDAGWSHYFDYFWDPTNPLAANASVSVAPKAGYTGNAYKVTILAAGVAEYAIQISYPVALVSGKKYAIRFKASADAARTVQLNMQQDAAPNTIWYTSNPIGLTTTPTVLGPYEFTATTTDPSNFFKFYLGGGTNNAISAYFDDVEVREVIDVPGATVPDAPTIGTAVAGGSRATVAFTPPANDGGISINSYTVTSSPGAITATGTASPITVNGLTNGQAYTFTVVANNGLGASAASAASNSVTPIFQPTSYFVKSGTGNDNNNGTSVNTPFATFAKAASVMIAGDTAFIMTGVYEPFTITKSGDSTANITYKAYPNDNPIITCGPNGAWNLLQINASYVTVDGLEIKGINQSLTLAQGEANYNNMLAVINAGGTPDYGTTTNTNTNGISFSVSYIAPVHHIIIKNCRVHDCSAGGIGGGNADYITIENNEIYNNSWYTMWATSGISVINLISIDTSTTQKIIIRGNKIYNNYCGVKWISIQNYSDGNGIIIDVNHSYTASFLVENNLVFDNGGRGLYIMDAGNATFRNNTSYWNSKSSFSTGGEMVCYNAHDVKFINNIGWANPAYSSENYGICDNGNWGANSNITWKNNLAFNGTTGQSSTYINKTSTTSVDNTNKTGIDPMFVNPTIDPATANFKVQSASPVKDAGTSAYGVPMYDIAYSARVQGSSIDIGAYESTSSVTLPLSLLSFTAKRTNAFTAVLNWNTAQEYGFDYFDLEKASDNQSFKKIGIIKSKGNPKDDYEFTDDKSTAVNLYYRLKIVDKDGSFRYSNVVLLRNTGNEDFVGGIYPNPVSAEYANLDIIAKESGTWSVSVVNILGQKIELQNAVLVKGANQLKVNLSTLPAGVHFLKIENNGEVYIRKVVKN